MNHRALVVMTVLGSSVVSGGWLLGRGLHDNPTNASEARLFDAVFSHVKRFYVDSLADSALFDRAMVGMLRELGDPYSLYLPAQRLRRLTERSSGNYIGIGAQIQRRDDWPMIVAPMPGSPAERAGLHTGDRLVEIDGASAKGWTNDETVRALRGPPGTTVKLVIERPGDPRRLTLTLTRGGVHRRAISRTSLLRDGVGYVDVNVFNDSTEGELQQAIDSLRREGMRSLIVDLRGNPGGVLAQGVGVADLFLDPGRTIVVMKGRSSEANQTYTDSVPQLWPDLPLVVLLDEWSASASEILAGALQDNDRAVLMGRSSFGKGSAQGVFGMSSGGAVKLTTGRWYTPSGRTIERLTRQSDADADSTRGPAFRSVGGRVLRGGGRGGIVPDVILDDTSFSPAEQALDGALGTRANEFRDAMVDVAIELKTRGAITTRDFSVTGSMLDALWSASRKRGFSFDRAIFDGASDLVSQLLAREIARYIFGSQAEAERAIREDRVIQEAVRFVGGVRTTEELLKKADAGTTGTRNKE
jgi:carboxyl-terminal processing protease